MTCDKCGSLNCANSTDWPCDVWRLSFLTTETLDNAARAMRRQVDWTREQLETGGLTWTEHREREIASRERQAELYETASIQRGL